MSLALFLFPALVGISGDARAADDIGVKVPDGFSVQLFADDEFAHDVFSLTIDSVGRVVVSGPGYVRILIDDNGDGKADRFKQFVDGPAGGAQGMYFQGSNLLCSGDTGLVRYVDENKDDRADGPPEVFLKVKTGGEHNAHAVRKGPDGWWYLIVGNTAEITAGYATLKTSPVKFPEAGTLLRLKPDLSGGEIVAHGIRNAYDFDFNEQGELFTFDSDDERDVSLPWYRPTRVFQLLPGAHLGWISKGWKRPDYFYDMPPVVASFGRGSPTGVVCYRHRQFPKPYQGALFVLDWTYGRVWAVPMERAGEAWKSQPIDFMSATGEVGFAPTDADVGPDGSLYISVGGRGTRGAVFRITANQPNNPPSEETTGATPVRVNPLSELSEQKVMKCLEAPQPLSSWSRAQWMPVAKELGAKPFLDAASNEGLAPAARVRAIEIVTELFGGLDADSTAQLSRARSAEVRAATAWSLDRRAAAGLAVGIIANLVGDNDPLVRRTALGAVATSPQFVAAPLDQGPLTNVLTDPHRFVRSAASRTLAALPAASFEQLGAAARSDWRAALTYAEAFRLRGAKAEPTINAYGIEIGRRILAGKHDSDLKLDAVRLIQLGLGDLGNNGKSPSSFDGYSPVLDLEPYERDLDPLRISLGQVYPTGDRLLDIELTRLIAMLTLYNTDVLDKLLTQITPTSDPIDDLHYLLVAARMPVPRSSSQQAAIARGLIEIEPKLVARKLPQDTNWDDRFTEMYEALVEHDPGLPEVLVNEPNFGQPAHVNFLTRVPGELLPTAAAAFARQIAKDPDYRWNNDVVFLFGMVDTPEYRKLICDQYDRFSVRSAVQVALSGKPHAEDRPKFIDGLESSQPEVLRACVEGLEKLPVPSGDVSAEVVALVRTLRRLGSESEEQAVGERIIKLLERITHKKFDYAVGPKGYRPQPTPIKALTTWAAEAYPQHASTLWGGAESDVADVRKRLSEVSWEKGDANRGQKLFRERACAQCHGGSRALGPDLSGIASRFSREDLFIAIALPNRDVSPRYQATLIETKSGKTYSGLIIYESVDGLLLRNSTSQTIRIETDEVAGRKKSSTSLMPSGLLKDLTPGDLADLYSYLQTLTSRTAKGPGLAQPE